jgi:signal transduction histidine kinase
VGTRDDPDAPVEILLVDDRPENLVALELVLERPDRRLLKATSGNEALRLLLRHEVAVILMDVQMPDMDGYETARLIRADARGRLTPILFVTAGDRTDERSALGYEAGAVDFLQKPINTLALQSKVDVFLQLYRAAAEQRRLVRALERTTGELRARVADLEAINRTMSHDLRAPLRTIEGFAQALDQHARDGLDADDREHLDRIVRASGRMGAMLDGLQRLLRLGTVASSVVPTDAGRVLDGVLEDLRADLVGGGATVEHAALPTVAANPTLLALVLQNLIGNAIKFHGPGPCRIRVEAAPAGAGWRFAVHDDGPGIPPEYREKIFGVFQRLVGESAPGTGVGLALCRQAIEKHGGTIWVEGDLGRGSSFCFTLPGAVSG